MCAFSFRALIVGSIHHCRRIGRVLLLVDDPPLIHRPPSAYYYANTVLMARDVLLLSRMHVTHHDITHHHVTQHDITHHHVTNHDVTHHDATQRGGASDRRTARATRPVSSGFASERTQHSAASRSSKPRVYRAHGGQHHATAFGVTRKLRNALSRRTGHRARKSSPSRRFPFQRSSNQQMLPASSSPTCSSLRTTKRPK